MAGSLKGISGDANSNDGLAWLHLWLTQNAVQPTLFRCASDISQYILFSIACRMRKLLFESDL
jgi:hypothetical protein